MFSFRFESLLSQRRHVEEALQLDLAEARRVLSVEQAALRESKRARSQCMRDLRRAQQERFRVNDVLLHYPFLERLQQTIDGQLRRVAAAERKVNQQRYALLEAVKKRKTLEKLREKQAQAYQREAAASEQRVHDESAAQQYSRRY